MQKPKKPQLKPLEKLEKVNTNTDSHLKRLSMMIEGEHIDWERRSPQLRRSISIYPQTLTPEQRQRLNDIEQELITMADEASEETKNKTILKGKQP